jgi:hypothetical protein
MIDELLVHISTPATRQNDELYRSLADAYVNFEPHRTHPDISQPPRQLEAHPPTASVNGQATLLRGSFQHGTAGSSFLSTSKDSYGSFPSHLSSDGHSKGHGKTDGYDEAEDESEDESIPTSSRLAKLDRVHQNWKEQTTPRSSGQRPAKQVLSSPLSADTTFIEDTQLGAQALQSQLQDAYSSTDEDTSGDEWDDGDDAQGPLVPSVKPVERNYPSTGALSMLACSTATSASSRAPLALLKAPLAPTKADQALLGATPKSSTVTKERSKEVSALASTKAIPKSSNVVNQRRESLRLVTASSMVVTATPARFTAAPESSGSIAQPLASLPSSNSRSTVQISASSCLTAALKHSNVTTKPRRSLQVADLSTQSVSEAHSKVNSDKGADHKYDPAHAIDFTKHPVDAFPPEPKISVAQPGALPSQITKHLAAIKKQNPTRFKPSKKRYTPKADDRGYWAIHCSPWSEKLQQEFWATMCEQITAGRIGWGATLHRDAGSSRSLGQIRLYCWGEVVEHMWLVLWLCSRGKVVDSGLKWYDADGIAVFEMP